MGMTYPTPAQRRTNRGPAPLLRDWVDRYITDRKVFHDDKHNTLRSRKKTLYRLAEWHRSRVLDPREFGPKILKDFFSSTDGLDAAQPGNLMKPHNWNSHRDMCRGFIRWCQMQDPPLMGGGETLLEAIPAKKEDERNFTFIPGRQLAECIQSADDPFARACLAFNIGGLARQCHLRVLRYRHVKLDEEIIHWTHPKTGRVVTLPMTPLFVREARRWFTAFTEANGAIQPDWFVIPGRWRRGQKGNAYNPDVSIDDVTRIVKPYTERYMPPDSKGEGGSHTLRRSAAMALILSFDDPYIGLMVVKAMLGHKSLDTTYRYLRIDVDALMAMKHLKGRDFLPDLEAVSALATARDRAIELGQMSA